MEEEEQITGSIYESSQENLPSADVNSISLNISNLNRQVFNKTAFLDTVDTSFSELGVEEVDPSFFDIDLATIDDFFSLYDKFFFEIPKSGVNNSHEYLVIESGEYINFNQNQEEINALLEEIAQLRTENLELLQNNSELQIRLAQNLNQPSTGSITGNNINLL